MKRGEFKEGCLARQTSKDNDCGPDSIRFDGLDYQGDYIKRCSSFHFNWPKVTLYHFTEVYFHNDIYHIYFSSTFFVHDNEMKIPYCQGVYVEDELNWPRDDYCEELTCVRIST